GAVLSRSILAIAMNARVFGGKRDQQPARRGAVEVDPLEPEVGDWAVLAAVWAGVMGNVGVEQRRVGVGSAAAPAELRVGDMGRAAARWAQIFQAIVAHLRL